MTTIVVTGQGWGAIWKFDSLVEAQVHPQVRDGDAVMDNFSHMLRDYNSLEFPKLMRRLHVEGASAVDTALRSSAPTRQREIMRDNASRVWDALLVIADTPPHNPEKERLMTEAKKVAEKKTTEIKAAKPAAVAKEPKAPAGPRAPKGYGLEDKIHFGKNAEGKAYGPGNNPKRPNSGSHTRFALYKDGQTIGAALDAGVETADILWDANHKFIIIAKVTVAKAA